MLVMTAILGALTFAAPQAGPSTQRIVSASNVRLRSAPETSAAIVNTLAFGTELTQVEALPDGSWYRVTAPDGKAGWVFANLTEPFNAREGTDTYRRLVQARLKMESLSFAEARELSQFVDRIAPSIQGQARAEFDLLRLRALDRTLDHITREEPTDPAQKEWVKTHENELTYNEIGAEWLVTSSLYWELESKYHGNPFAQEIAWDASQTGIPGECEGYIPCSFAIFLLTDAKYLDLYPNGSHASEAVDHIDYILQEIVKPNTPYTVELNDAKELHESIAKLAMILERTSSPKKADMLARLKKIEEIPLNQH